MSGFCNLNDFECEMSMLPKFRNYLEKKKYYKQHGIEPLVPLEQGFSKEELKELRLYLSGKKSDRNGDQSSGFSTFVNATGQHFESSGWKKDPRFERLEKKQQRDKDANIQRRNYSAIEKNYDMYSDDKNFASAMGDNFEVNTDFGFEDIRDAPVGHNQIHDFNILQNSNDIFRQEKTNPYDARIPQKNKMIINNPPKISQYNSRVHYGENSTEPHHRREINKIIGKIDTYRQRDDKEENCSNIGYRNMPRTNNSIKYDVDTSNYLTIGSSPGPTSKKSFGYPSTFEHNFQYISNDIQDPNHVVMERPFPTRSFNRGTEKPQYSREVML